MGLDWNRINECRQNYVDKRNRENEDIALENGLTEEQISAIEDICRLRHEIHTVDTMDIYFQQCSDSDLVEKNLDKINELIEETDLPKLTVDSLTYSEDWVIDIDWDELMSDDDKEPYYIKAKERMKDNDDIDTIASECFIEHACEVNSEIKKKINDVIEKWLRDIDEKYGTHYAPTGGQRL